ncbi:MAG: hypothetical protein IJQ81_11030, partial [Oscillibacter sp.]|nr:hypothetical protein [Oscillibacter sp.]
TLSTKAIVAKIIFSQVLSHYRNEQNDGNNNQKSNNAIPKLRNSSCAQYAGQTNQEENEEKKIHRNTSLI